VAGDVASGLPTRLEALPEVSADLVRRFAREQFGAVARVGIEHFVEGNEHGIVRPIDLRKIALQDDPVDAFHFLDVEVHDVPLVFFAETARGKTTLSAVGQAQHHGRFTRPAVAVTKLAGHGIAHTAEAHQVRFEPLRGGPLPVPARVPGPGPQRHPLLDFNDVHTLARPPNHFAPLVSQRIAAAHLLHLVEFDVRTEFCARILRIGVEVLRLEAFVSPRFLCPGAEAERGRNHCDRGQIERQAAACLAFAITGPHRHSSLRVQIGKSHR